MSEHQQPEIDETPWVHQVSGPDGVPRTFLMHRVRWPSGGFIVHGICLRCLAIKTGNGQAGERGLMVWQANEHRCGVVTAQNVTL